MQVTNQPMYSNEHKKRNVSGNLTQDDFLKILVAQMRYQDPFAPTNDNEFISQMVQFSSLEQMVNMNSNLALMNYMMALGFDSTNAFTLIGKVVEIQVKDEEPIIGTVDKVLQKDGQFYIEVNSELYTLDQVISVSNEIKTVPDEDESDLDEIEPIEEVEPIEEGEEPKDTDSPVAEGEK